MQLTSLRLGMTKNLGNYESAKLEAEAIPSDGQTAAELFAELSSYVETQLSGGKPEGGPAKEAAEPKKSTAEKSTAEKSTAEKSTAKKSSAKKSTKAEHEKELQYVLDSESIEELLERFNVLRDPAAQFVSEFGTDGWEAAVTSIADRYRKLNRTDSDPGIQQQLVAAFRAERNYIENCREAA